MKRRELIVGLMAITAIPLAACSRQLATYRYRMTVEIDTPQGVRTGSSVIEVATSQGSGVPNRNLGYRVRGEAVAVDLPARQTVFALLRIDQDGWGGAEAFAPNAYEHVLQHTVGNKDVDVGKRLGALESQREPATLPRWVQRGWPSKRVSSYPTFVRFRDILDPKTIEKVDPDNLSATFGPGLKLRRITIQIVDDPVTTGIEKRFSWWTKYRHRHFDDSSTVSEDMTSKDITAHMTSGSFSTEFNRIQ